MDLSLIVAIGNNRVIGKDGKIPWHIPEDLQLFKQITEGGILIMGENTWKSLPIKPLPKRENIILSETLENQEGAYVFNNLENALAYSEKLNKEIFFIGGASVYRQAIDLVDKMHISLVKGNYTGDTYFPEFDKKKWIIEDKKQFKDFTYNLYKRK